MSLSKQRKYAIMDAVVLLSIGGCALYVGTKPLRVIDALTVMLLGVIAGFRAGQAWQASR